MDILDSEKLIVELNYRNEIVDERERTRRGCFIPWSIRRRLSSISIPSRTLSVKLKATTA
jgi:hypothetical protein